METAVAEEKRVKIRGKKETFRILQEGPALTQVEDDDGHEFWVSNNKLTPVIPSPVRPRSLGAAARWEREVVATEISDALLALLRSDPPEIRVHYPPRVEEKVQQFMSEQGIVLPADIRPIASGSHGGVFQRDWSGAVHFSRTIPENMLPEGTKDFVCHRRGVAVVLLKAGFPLTLYTKFEQ